MRGVRWNGEAGRLGRASLGALIGRGCRTVNAATDEKPGKRSDKCTGTYDYYAIKLIRHFLNE